MLYQMLGVLCCELTPVNEVTADEKDSLLRAHFDSESQPVLPSF